MSHAAEQATRTNAPGPWYLSAMPTAIRGGAGGGTSCAAAGSATHRTASRQASASERGWRTARQLSPDPRGRIPAFRQVRVRRCDPISMEAATTLPFAQVRVVADRLYVDGLVLED